MKVLVTGATGNVGGHLVSSLRTRGVEVRGSCAGRKQPDSRRVWRSLPAT